MMSNHSIKHKQQHWIYHAIGAFSHLNFASRFTGVSSNSDKNYFPLSHSMLLLNLFVPVGEFFIASPFLSAHSLGHKSSDHRSFYTFSYEFCYQGSFLGNS